MKVEHVARASTDSFSDGIERTNGLALSDRRSAGRSVPYARIYAGEVCNGFQSHQYVQRPSLPTSWQNTNTLPSQSLARSLAIAELQSKLRERWPLAVQHDTRNNGARRKVDQRGPWPTLSPQILRTDTPNLCEYLVRADKVSPQLVQSAWQALSHAEAACFILFIFSNSLLGFSIPAFSASLI